MQKLTIIDKVHIRSRSYQNLKDILARLDPKILELDVNYCSSQELRLFQEYCERVEEIHVNSDSILDS